VIVAGVLAAGLWHKAWLDPYLSMPFPAAMLYSYGIVGFSIPLTWSILTLVLLRRPEVLDETKDLMFWLGVLMLVVLVVFVVYADVTPLLHGTWGLAAGDGG
jgi:hypothetical protein